MTTTRRSMLGLLGAIPVAATVRPAAADTGVEAAIQAIIGRPEFRDSRWGMAFYSPDTDRFLYALRPADLFVPASAIKVFIAGTAFSALGSGHRFRTRVYGTGLVTGGVLHGDLVLVAGGDLLLGGRSQPDGTLALPDPDHTYGGFALGAAPLPGDPLSDFRRLAARVAARGITRVAGRVMVDASLFREATEDIANGGLPVTVSPMMLNDNVVDVTVRPGGSVGAPAIVDATPSIGYVRIVNEVRTIDGAPAGPLRFVNDTANPDGTRTVTLTGEIAVGTPSLFSVYYVPMPVHFGAMAFATALRDRGVRIDAGSRALDGARRRLLVEHVSLPVSDEVKVMLKVSSNVHTVMWPHVVGAIAGHSAENPVAAYEMFRTRLFRRAGLDPSPPGESEGRYSPDFFVRFLGHLRKRPDFAEYRSALPIMGRDGSLANIEVGSPAAGRVYAKTGTGVLRTSPTSDATVHKALAGFIQLAGGRWLSFAAFMEGSAPSIPAGADLANRAGKALGEIATAAYTSFS